MAVFDRLKSADPVVFGMTAALVIFGLIMLMSATGPIGMQRANDSFYYVRHQLLVGVLPGSVLFFLFALIPYRFWKAMALPALIASLLLLISVFLPGIGQAYGGSHSWVHIGPFNFQPSEIAKLSFLIYLAAWLSGRKDADVRSSAAPFFLALGVVMGLLLLEPDTGSMAVIVGMSLLLYFISGAPVTWFLGLGVLGAGLLAMLIKFSPYRAARFMTFLHPELDPKGIGYHINQAILAIGSGGFWGLGYGHSRQKFLYLPEVEADSIIAVIAEEMGFWLILILIAAFTYLVWRCFKIAKEAHDPFGTYLAAGIGSWLGIQVLLNVASMTGLMPMTGVTLPFISHGGSSMVVLLAAMGLLASVSARDTIRTRL
ncbi:MAG: putative lipid II flippase FtsW [bacterium]|nr:putative lipid II flippase FtsW [bacterium]